MPNLWHLITWLQILKAHIWRNLWSQPPPANKHSHHPTTHRGALLDVRDLLYQPLAWDCRSWSSDPGKMKMREGGVIVQEQGRVEGVRTRQKHISRLHSSHLFEQQALAMTPQAWKIYCVMFISGCWWWLGLISESCSDQTHVKQCDGGEMRDYRRHTHTHLHKLLRQGHGSRLD